MSHHRAVLSRAIGACLLLLLHAGCQSQTESDGYTLVLQDIPAALMSVSGTTANDVWLVGADQRDGHGALVMHYDGDALSVVPAGISADLWWVQAFDATRVHFSGSKGTFVTSDGHDFTVHETPGTATAYGTWGATPDDAWIVGGDPGLSPGFLWHFDGASVTDLSDTLPASELPPLFKVFGQAADDVFIVGMDGTAFHYDGAAWTVVDLGTTRRVFTIHGSGGHWVAVGGFGSGVILESDGGAFESVADDTTPQLYGVFMTSANTGYAVGSDGAVLRRDATGFHTEDIGIDLYFPLHAVWADDLGGFWAVGGDVETPALNRGMLLHHGPALGTIPEFP